MVAWAQIVAGLVSAGTAAPTDSDALELYAGGSLELYGSGAPTAFDSIPIIFRYIL